MKREKAQEYLLWILEGHYENGTDSIYTDAKNALDVIYDDNEAELKSKKEVIKYFESKKDLKRVQEDYTSSFMDVSIRMDRVAAAKDKAIVALGKEALKKILKTNK